MVGDADPLLGTVPWSLAFCCFAEGPADLADSGTHRFVKLTIASDSGTIRLVRLTIAPDSGTIRFVKLTIAVDSGTIGFVRLTAHGDGFRAAIEACA